MTYGRDFLTMLNIKKFLLAQVFALALCFGHANYAPAFEQQPLVRMAHIAVKPGLRDAFIAAVTQGMRTAVQTEPGVLALYCVADKTNPDKLLFFEIYANEAAYKAHLATAHFKKYIEITKDMASSKVLLETVPIELQDKWHKHN